MLTSALIGRLPDGVSLGLAEDLTGGALLIAERGTGRARRIGYVDEMLTQRAAGRGRR